MNFKPLIQTTFLATTILNSCETLPPAHLNYSQQEIVQNNLTRKERKKNAQSPLEQKIRRIETQIQNHLTQIGNGKLIPRYVHDRSRKNVLHLEVNAMLLSAYAAKYEVTKDPKTKDVIDQIVKGIIALDTIDGYDGYVPLKVEMQTLERTHKPTHSNAYVQLLFAYSHLPESKLVEEHVSKIYHCFASQDFELNHLNGKPIKKADLNKWHLSLHPTRALDRRVIDQCAIHLGDKSTQQMAGKTKWNGPIIAPTHLKLGSFEIPTASSSWLNLLKLHTLEELGLDCESRLTKLARKYERDKNPFFQTLAYLNDGSTDISWVRSRLDEYPLPAKSGKLINSHRSDITRGKNRYVKGKSSAEGVAPVPLYDLGSDEYLWKRNLRALNRGGKAGKEYFAVDLLQAYWFLELAKHRDKVKQH